MAESHAENSKGSDRSRFGIRRWIRVAFITWAIVSTLWLANSMRTRGVSADTLRSSSAIVVHDRDTTLEFAPTAFRHDTALIFFCGSGVSADAYAPLLRPVSEAGYAVFIVKLPYRFAPFPSHKDAALDRARAVIAGHPEVSRWVVAGHSRKCLDDVLAGDFLLCLVCFRRAL